MEFNPGESFGLRSPSSLPLRHFQPFLTPYPLNPLVIHPPPAVPQQLPYPPIRVCVIGTRRRHDLLPKSLLIRLHHRFSPLCRSGVSYGTAGAPFRDLQHD